jgi:hypothetical protein
MNGPEVDPAALTDRAVGHAGLAQALRGLSHDLGHPANAPLGTARPVDPHHAGAMAPASTVDRRTPPADPAGHEAGQAPQRGGPQSQPSAPNRAVSS